MVVLCGIVPAVAAPQRATEPPHRVHPGPDRTDARREAREEKHAQASNPEQQPGIAAPQAAQPGAAPQAAPQSPTQQQLQQSPPVPPQVTFENGQLSINAPNSNLADVLNAVKARTGASLELPANAAQERVAVELGPGPPRDVLAKLLDGSPFDYILMGSPNQLNAITQILITPTNASGAPAPSQPMQRAESQPEPGDDQPANDTPEPVQLQAPPPPPPGANMPPENNAPNAAPESPGNGQPGQGNQVKSPQQLLQELQRMQQREQQQRQQQQKPPQSQ